MLLFLGWLAMMELDPLALNWPSLNLGLVEAVMLGSKSHLHTQLGLVEEGQLGLLALNL
jgi:hypothetical protein